MLLVKIFSALFIFSSAGVVRARAPYLQVSAYNFHLPVLTRPPVRAASTSNAPKKSTTTTTTEQPEVEEPEVVSQNRRNLEMNAFDTYAYDYYNPLLPMSNYNDYGSYGGALGGGFGSWEEPDDDLPTTRTNRNRHTRTSAPTTTTTTTTTTAAPTTPEADDDITTSAQTSSFSSVSGGFCFCSPLPTCPAGSVHRGGTCTTFLFRYVVKGSYRRCCYSPSLAKQLGI